MTTDHRACPCCGADRDATDNARTEQDLAQLVTELRGRVDVLLADLDPLDQARILADTYRAIGQTIDRQTRR